MNSSIIFPGLTLLRSSASPATLVKFAGERGLSLDATLAGSGLKPGVLDDPHAEIETWQELAMIRNVTRALGDTGALGLEVGQRYHITSHGTLGFALLGCQTMRRALELAFRYFELSSGFTRFRLEEHGSEAHLICDDDHIPEDIRFFVLQRDAAGLRTLRRDLISAEPSVHRICVRHARPKDAEILERYWGTRIEFGALHNMSVFDRDFLETRLPQANEHTVRMCEAQLSKLVARRRAARGFVGRLRDKLVAELPNLPDMETAAVQLGVTSRTLRRRLADEGTTFRRLLDELRLTLAQDLLRAGELPVSQIAYEVGYADTSSFFHAFKRMTGKTPSEISASRRGCSRSRT